MTNTFLQVILPLVFFILMALIGSVVIMILPFIFGGKMVPAHSVFKTNVIDMAEDKFFDLISDYENYPLWRSYLKKVETGKNKEGKTVWREYYKFGRKPVEFTEIKKEKHKLIFTNITNEYIAVWTMETKNIDNEKIELAIKETVFFPHRHIRFFSKLLASKDYSINNIFKQIAKEAKRLKNDKL